LQIRSDGHPHSQGAHIVKLFEKLLNLPSIQTRVRFSTLRSRSFPQEHGIWMSQQMPKWLANKGDVPDPNHSKGRH
jgi:hypothetical protein